MDDKHKNEIEVLSWRWNIHQEIHTSTPVAASAPGRSPSPDFDHYIDRASEPVQILRLRQAFTRPFWLCVRLAAIHTVPPSILPSQT